MKCEVSLRKDLFGHILVCGGSSMFCGLRERLEREMSFLVSPTVRMRVVAPPGRDCAAWVGGSLLASLQAFQSLWLTKEQYDEHGPSLIHAKAKQITLM
eukprot:TRINITY_DN15319_c0_g3_i1.p1 TRINITY_DN15319_c0_g3~~TRINITY_DN15319_c0_g3_i1.p1  ORF type:complete len:112 (-),score=16.76 TRINITY_DN15319_c0_g3_i1:2-298(-)